MGYLIGYFIIGLIIIYAVEKAIIGFSLKITLSNQERIAIAGLWPLAIIIFSISFIKELFK